MVSWFRQMLHPPGRVDPVFGEIRRTGKLWTGQALFVGSVEPIVVDIFAGTDGPTETQRQIYSELRRRFEELRPPMATSLFTEYQAIRSSREDEYKEANDMTRFPTDYPPVKIPSDIWTIASLFRVEVYGNGDVDLVLDFEIRWADGDHQLNVLMKQFEILEVMCEG